ncbi:hypothetical protein B296_00042457, partial [Ensete ventricosum]
TRVCHERLIAAASSGGRMQKEATQAIAACHHPHPSGRRHAVVHWRPHRPQPRAGDRTGDDDGSDDSKELGFFLTKL